MRRLHLTLSVIALSAALCMGAPPKSTSKKKGATPPPRTSQSIKEEKRSTTKEIKETNRKIDANTRETAKHVSQLNVLNAEIAQTDAHIKKVSVSVDSLNRLIYSINVETLQLDKEVKELQRQYSAALHKYQGHRRAMSPLTFLFSSKSFNEAYRRFRYLQQFSKWRKKKTEEIRLAQDRLKAKRELLAQNQQLRNSSLKELNAAQSTLISQQTQTDKLVASLKKEGSALREYLRVKENEARALDNQLEIQIALEDKKRKAEAQAKAAQRQKQKAAAKPAPAPPTKAPVASPEVAAAIPAAPAKTPATKSGTKVPTKPAASNPASTKPVPTKPAPTKPTPKGEIASATPVKPAPPAAPAATRKETPKPAPKPAQSEPKATPAPASSPAVEADTDFTLSSDFVRSKGQLPYPVFGTYRIVRHYGALLFPGTEVKTRSNGLDLEVSPGGKARAIYPGKVSAVFVQPGYNTVVMVRHGDYITIYGGLASIFVKNGDTLKPNQTIGIVSPNPQFEGRSILHFELRKGATKLNPEEWLR